MQRIKKTKALNTLERRITMAQTMPLNNLANNENFTYPFDVIEKGLNLIGSYQNLDSEASLKSLFSLLEESRKQVYQNHELKQGLIYYFIGENFLKQQKYSFAQYALEISKEMLSGYTSLVTKIKEYLNNVFIKTQEVC